MACLRSWEVHPLLAQGPSTAPALAGEGSVSGCTSIVGLRPQYLRAWEEAHLRGHFPTWEGSVLSHSQAGGCRQLLLGDDTFQSGHGNPSHLPCSALCSGYPRAMVPLPPLLVWAGQANKGVPPLHHPDLHDSFLWCPYTHPSAASPTVPRSPLAGCPPLLEGRKASGAFNWELAVPLLIYASPLWLCPASACKLSALHSALPVLLSKPYLNIENWLA